jgi:hypothetical protein
MFYSFMFALSYPISDLILEGSDPIPALFDPTPLFIKATPPFGEKKEDKQQTHMTKAIEKMPNLPVGLFELSACFLSRTKLISRFSFLFTSF